MAGTSYWDIIVPIVAAWVGNKYGNPNGNTPNQYPAVLPPEVKRVADEAWRVYQAGGSPIQQEIRDMARQSAAQTPSEPQGFKFVSQELRDQPFAGGIKAPKYTPLPPGGGAPAKPPAPPLYRNTNPGPHDPNSKGRQPFNDIVPDLGETLPGPRYGTNRNQGGARDPESLPPDIEYSHPDFGKVADAWNKYKAEHPNWAKLGANVAVGAITAALGLPGMVVGPILRNLVMRDRPPAPGPTPPTGQAPGYIPPGGTPSGILRP